MLEYIVLYHTTVTILTQRFHRRTVHLKNVFRHWERLMCQKGYDMKRYFALIAAAALLLTGCQSGKTESPEESSGVTSTAEQTAASDVTSAESAPDTQPEDPTVPTAEAQTAESPDSAESTVFRPGVWRGTSEYFLFYTDGTGGATQNFEMGIGVAFEYEYGDGNVVFHMGSSDNNTVAVPSDITEDSVTLTWEDGTVEKFEYVSDDPEGFRFYTNEELGQIALRYYMANSPEGYVPGCIDVQNNDDGYAVVQLYDVVDDHTATSAWYMLNRVTLTGSDGMTGSAVIMSDYAEEGTAEG